MHVPTAAVVRPAQRSVIGIIGARQRVLTGEGRHGTSSTDKDTSAVGPCNPPDDMKRHNREFEQHIQTCMQWLVRLWSILKGQFTQMKQSLHGEFWFYLPSEEFLLDYRHQQQR